MLLGTLLGQMIIKLYFIQDEKKTLRSDKVLGIK
jgi:hypothetical protein